MAVSAQAKPVSQKQLVIGALGTALFAALLFFLFSGGKKEDSADAPESEAAAGTASANEQGLVSPTRLGPTGVIRAEAVSGMVRGTILELGSGEAVPWVDVIFRTNGQEASASSDGSGNYEIELAPGQYEVRAVGAEVVARALPQLRIGGVREVTLDIEVARLATIRGRVMDPEGGGIEGVEILLRTDTGSGKNFPNRGEIGFGVSEGDGGFELHVPPGGAALEATLGQTTVFVNVPELVSGKSVEDLEIIMDRRGIIQGEVRLPGGAPAVGARVLVTHRRTGTSQFLHREAQTDSAGQFRVEELTPVTHLVEATLDGYGSADPLEMPLSAEMLEVALELSLHEPQELSGKVVDQEGRPVSGVRVAQVRQGSKQFFAKVNTYADGEFSFTELSPGPHMLRAGKEGYAPVTMKDVMAPKKDIVMTLVLSGSLKGVVMSAEGVAIERFVVELRPSSAPKKPGKKSQFYEKNGSFQIYPVDPGSYRVLVSAEGYAGATIDGATVAAGESYEASIVLKAK